MSFNGIFKKKSLIKLLIDHPSNSLTELLEVISYFRVRTSNSKITSINLELSKANIVHT